MGFVIVLQDIAGNNLVDDNLEPKFLHDIVFIGFLDMLLSKNIDELDVAFGRSALCWHQGHILVDGGTKRSEDGDCLVLNGSLDSRHLLEPVTDLPTLLQCEPGVVTIGQRKYEHGFDLPGFVQSNDLIKVSVDDIQKFEGEFILVLVPLGIVHFNDIPVPALRIQKPDAVAPV